MNVKKLLYYGSREFFFLSTTLFRAFVVITALRTIEALEFTGYFRELILTLLVYVGGMNWVMNGAISKTVVNKTYDLLDKGK